MNFPLRIGKSSRDRSHRDSSMIGFPRLSLGDASSKWRHSRNIKGSSHCSSSKKRRTSPLVPFDAEGEESEAPLSLKPSRHKEDNGQCSLLYFFCRYIVTLPLFTGFEDVPRMFSTIFGVRTEAVVPEVRDIHEVGVPPFSLVSANPFFVCSGPSLSHGVLGETLNLVTTPTSDLPKTL